MLQLDQRAMFVFFIHGIFISLFFIFMLIPLTFFLAIPFSILTLTGNLDVETVKSYLIIALGIYFMFIMIFPFIWSWLYYRSFKYAVDKNVIRIDKGIVWKKHITIPFNRIQNIDISRGPLMRILGLADVKIQTAGSSTPNIVEGTLPGVARADAEKIREAVLFKVPK